MIKQLIKLRAKVSQILAYAYNKTKYEPPIPKNLGELQEFMSKVYDWESDPLWGIMDHIQPIEHMNYQLLRAGVIVGDCDDFATYTCYMLRRMGYAKTYRVNMPKQLHVICVFQSGSKWFWASNNFIYTVGYDDFIEAVKGWYIRHNKDFDGCYFAERICVFS